MNTVQKNNNITIKKIQEFLKGNSSKLGFSETSERKIVKALKSKYTSKTMRKIFYQECTKRLNENQENVGNTFKHITSTERITIEVLYTAGFKVSFIANFIHKHRSSIKREIEKNIEEIWDINSTKSPYREKGQINIKIYSSKRAQIRADKNKDNSRKKCKLDKNPKLRETVVTLLKNKQGGKGNKVTYSPDVISGLIKAGKVAGVETTISAGTIYSAIHKRKYGLKLEDLPFGRKYYKATQNKHTLTKEVSERKKEISIEKMPEEVKEKKTSTHFEGDSVVGVRSGKHETLITLANTKSEFLFIERSKAKTGQETVNVLDRLEKKIPQLPKIIETLLLDNGVEFSKIDEMMRSAVDNEKKRFQIYFAHPYASYERGCNENKNRMIRRYFRKGTLVEDMSDERILEIARMINNMPRKKLGYRTPLEVFEEDLKKRNIDTKFLDEYRIELPKCLVA